MSLIKNFIVKHNLINDSDTIVVGLSGGPDSVCLLHMLVQTQQTYNLTIIAAHLNHEWRSEANAEEELCRTIAQTHNIPFVSQKLSQLTFSIKQNGSKEEYARKARRFFLEQVLHQYNAQSIALAHHAQDQQETFFIRLIRGTSLTGLTAMKPRHGLYIRPLLETNKSDILGWLASNNIAYATDTSNESPAFLRNRIRTTVLPALHACDKRFDVNFLATLHNLKQDENYLIHITQQTFDTISYIEDNKRMVDILALFKTHPALHYRLIIHWLISEKVQFPVTQAFFDEIMRFLHTNRGGIHVVNQQWSIVKKQNKAYITMSL